MLTFANMKLKSKIRYIIILSLPLLILATGGSAQKWKLKRYEAIVGVGTAHYFGDIGGSAGESNLFGIKDIEIKGTRPSVYFGIRYKIRPNIAVKTNFIYGFLAGSDENSLYTDRGYSFTGKIFEPSVQFEYSFISEEQRHRSSAMFNRRGMMNNYSKINLYIFAGVGGGFVNTEQTGIYPDRTNYYEQIDFVEDKTMGLVFPVGLGGKFVLSGTWSVGAELGGRFTTTDYLDGFTTIWSNHNDVYYFLTIQAIYRIRTSRQGYPILFQRGRRGF